MKTVTIKFKVRYYNFNQVCAKSAMIRVRNTYERNGYSVAYMWSGQANEYLLMAKAK